MCRLIRHASDRVTAAAESQSCKTLAFAKWKRQECVYAAKLQVLARGTGQ
jgi:hypothetical protein